LFSYYTVAPYDVTITGESKCKNGDELELKCGSNGGPCLEYLWSRSRPDDLPQDAVVNTDTLTISHMTAADAGEYRCQVSNNAGSSSATITIYGEFVHA